jgi:hypothetical protein
MKVSGQKHMPAALTAADSKIRQEVKSESQPIWTGGREGRKLKIPLHQEQPRI